MTSPPTKRRRRLWSEGPALDEGHDWLGPRPGEAPPPEPTEPAAEPAAQPDPARRTVAPLRAVVLAALVSAAAVAAILVLVGVVGVPQDDEPLPLPAAPPVEAPRGGSDARVAAVYRAASRSVVSVRAAQGPGVATGTGFVVDDDGTIVTNAHVVSDSRRVQVRFGDRGRRVQGEVAGTDPSSDLAVVRIDPSAAGSLVALPLADSRRVRVGELAVAIGSPFGLDRTATAGIVSSTGREIQAPNGFSIDRVIQTDAPINPGNSGGPLLNAAAQVIGVNSQIATAGARGNVGVGFAVPSNTVREVVPKLKRDGRVRRPYLGVSTTANPGGSGALVIEVPPGSPADDAGVQGGAGDGDVIVSVDGRAVRAPRDVSAAINGRDPGDRIRLGVLRNGRRIDIEVTLGTRPARVPTP